jgi:hypothetical protein
MSATKIAATFRVSLTALMPKQPDRRSLEHFRPEVHAASVVEIIEIAQTDIPKAEANLYHPFAVPPIPRDTGLVGLGHGCTSTLGGR